VIILNYNGIEFVEQCVRSVLKSDYPNFELVVVDNASTDGSYEAVRQSFSRVGKVRAFRNERNLGFALGNNVGYMNSKGDIVAFLNVDTMVERSWLRELVDVLISDVRVGAVHSKQMSLRDRSQLESLGAYMDPLGFVYPRAWWAHTQSPLGRAADEPFYPDGGSMALRRSALEKVAIDGQPFDGDYFLYFEDNDLGWRLRLAGYKIVCVPASVLYHYRGASASAASLYARTFSFAKNRLFTLIKNYDMKNLSRFLAPVVFLEIVRAVLLLPKQPSRARAKLGALLWCLVNLKQIWKKRLYVQSFVRAVPDSEVMKYMVRPNFSVLRKRGFGALY
jgi:hypothetical protein